MSTCLFCAIAAGEVAADLVHSDDRVVAFRDVNPQAPTHVLVIPREHIASARELTPTHAELWSQVLQVAQRVAAEDGVAESGFRLVVNTGPAAGQTVHHVHVHVLGGRSLGWPPG